MQSHLDLETTASQETRSRQEDAQSFDGEHIAQIFRYYRRLQNPYKSKTIPMKLVSGKSLYNKHKALFDAFAKIVSKNNFDVESYIKYCVNCGIAEDNLETCFASTTMISKYAIHLKKVSYRKKIYKWFLKSVKNIATECVDIGYFTTKDFLRMLIDTNQIGLYVLTGKISLYYFAAIPNFKKIIPKLDYFSQKELTNLDNHFDVYHSEVNRAFLQEKNMYVNPIDLTDKAIWNLRSKKSNLEELKNSQKNNR